MRLTVNKKGYYILHNLSTINIVFLLSINMTQTLIRKGASLTIYYFVPDVRV